MCPSSATLPWTWYHEAGVYRREQTGLFRTAWHYVAHREALSEPGTCLPVTLGSVPVVLTRDTAGTIRALANVCRHRGAVVCESAATLRALRCPYHGWSYHLDGSLRAAPRSEREPGFDPGAHALTELPTGRWGPFIFVAPGPGAPDFTATLGRLPELVSAAGIDVDALRFVRRAGGDYRANWKVCVENFLECYHCRIAHPGFSRVVVTDPGEYLLEPADTYSTQYGPTTGSGDGAFVPQGPITRSQFHLLYPATTINIMPGLPNLSIGPVVPRGPGRTHRFLDYFVAPGVDDQWVDAMFAFDDRVGEEDRVLVESVQRGLEAGVHDRGTLFLDSESLVAHFQRYVMAAIG